MTVKSLAKFYTEHKEGAWVMKWPDPLYLYNYVKEYPIKKVLDLGTGIGLSTATVALALKEKGVDYEIHTVDQYAKCYNLAQELMPKDLLEGIKFYHTPAVVWQTEYIPHHSFSNFETLPDKDFDLIIVDGPGPWVEGDKLIELPNGDVIKMLIEDKIKKGALIAWDGRVKALAELERYFSDNFYFVFKGNNSDLRFLERKDGPLKFADTRYEGFKNSTYFNDSSNNPS